MEYRKLDPGEYEIRLLELLPPAKDGRTTRDTICCHMIQPVSLLRLKKYGPKYRALSYCWGDRRAAEDISVDGKRIPLTKNLLDALRELRQDLRQENFLWVDALCINQGDKYERSSQIRIIGQIYASATHTVTWLGSNKLRSRHPLQDLQYPGKSTGSNAIEAAEDIASRSYWKRAWIIQEIARASEVVIRCGGDSMPFPDFIRAIFATYFRDYISRHFLAVALCLFALRRTEDPYLVTSLSIELDLENDQDWMLQVPFAEQPNLITAAIMTRHAKAKYPRDKIYALLGVTSDGTTILQNPNYVQSTREVFIELSSNLIAEGHLGTLLLARRHADRKGARYLPSWVPNWSDLDTYLPPWIQSLVTGDNRELDGTMRRERLQSLRDGVFDISCKICGTVEAVFATSIQPAAGHIRGLSDLSPSVFIRQLVHCILGISDQYTDGNSDQLIDGNAQSKQKKLGQVFRTLFKRSKIGPEPPHDLFPNVIPGINGNSLDREVGEWLQKNFSLGVDRQTLLQALEREQTSGRLASRKPVATSDALDQTGVTAALRAFFLCLHSLAIDDGFLAFTLREHSKYKMRVVATDSRFWMAYQETEVGDVIAELKYLPLPVVLRKQQKHGEYQYIGEVQSYISADGTESLKDYSRITLV